MIRIAKYKELTNALFKTGVLKLGGEI